jgi:hypothetical protein
VLDEMSVMEGAGQLILLGEKDVQADLVLDQAERQRFDAIAQKFADQRAEMLQGYQNLSLDERRARFVELARSSERVTQSVLSGKKIQRLEQIVIQLQGIAAFNQPEIADELKLAEAQRQAMRQIEIETFIRLGEPSQSDDENSRRGVRQRVIQSAMTKCLATLRPAQLAIWKTMIGQPFEGHLSVMLPGVLPPP